MQASRRQNLLLVCMVVLGCLELSGGQRELLGWSQQTRLSDSVDELQLGHLYPNAAPKRGACINGTILKHLVTTSVTACELMCGYTPGCRWFAYCASHLDISLPVDHALQMEYCNEVKQDETLGPSNGRMAAKEYNPMYSFGEKRDKCVLYSQCLRVILNENGTVPFNGFHTYQYAPRGVMTGRTSIFPPQLPDKLKVKFHVPDSLHPNLRFWFAPEQLDVEGHAHGDRIKVWRNIANICYAGHPEYMMDPKNHSIILGNCNPSQQDSYVRGSWPQDYGEVTNFVQTIGNSQKEILYQHDFKRMPQYRTKVANGHSALRFKRKDTAGSQGKFLYLYTMLGDTPVTLPSTLPSSAPPPLGKQGFEDETRNPFASKSHLGSVVPSYRGAPEEFTLFLVVKTFSNAGDRNFHGLLNIIGSNRDHRWKGFQLFKNSATKGNDGFTSFSALNMIFGVGVKYDYSDCSTHCGRQACALTAQQLKDLGKRDCSCLQANPHAACLQSLGPPGAQHLQDPDYEWRLVTVRARRHRVEGFIDGFHASSQPPLLIEGQESFELVDQLRIGLLDDPESARSNFLNGDVAELLIYNKALTVQEMDRLANYLKVKYNLHSVRLNDDVASPTRSVALSKGPGCGGSMVLRAACNESNQHNTPYGKEALIEVHHAHTHTHKYVRTRAHACEYT